MKQESQDHDLCRHAWGRGHALEPRAGCPHTTLESKTNFLAAARLGSQVTGECTPRGEQTMVWQAKILAEDGRLLAVVVQTQLVLTP